jgi:Kef-type K+ transport system membrane component KefB
MQDEFALFAIFVVFSGAAVLGGIALYARQSLLVAYIVLGVLLGPSVFGVVQDTAVIQGIGHVGIIFLLFLLGLNLHPQKLLHMLREAMVVTAVSSVVFAGLGALIASAFGFSLLESLLIGCMMMFSSTIIGLKLLPTTALHHRRMGEIIISVLLLQDVIAIVMLVVLEGHASAGGQWGQIALLLLSLPAVAGLAFCLERFLLNHLIARFDAIQEYVFLVAIGWCAGFAELAHAVGLSYEMGAFIAGVALATSRISTYIAESLKPLRDFFLIMFFFSLGASFELAALGEVALPACVLALTMLVVKPAVFGKLLLRMGESQKLAREIGGRLGQNSEFSLLITVLAVQVGAISLRASYLVQTAVLITFIASSYYIMLRFPTPIAVSDRLRRD